MNSPSSPERFKEYIFREQYGDLVPIDIWGILKYYLGGDNSSESELANFRTKQYYKASIDSSENVVLAMEGKLIQIAFMDGSKAEVDFRDILIKRLSIYGSTFGPGNWPPSPGFAP